MAIEANNFAKQIKTSATDKLAQSSLGLAYVLKEQGGINITKDENLSLTPEIRTQVTSLLGISELASQLRQSLFEQAAENSITDSSKSEPAARTVANQTEFVQELLGNHPKLPEKLAEIEAKARLLSNALNTQPTSETAQELQTKVSTWQHTINEVAQILSASEAEKARYQSMVETDTQHLQTSSAKNPEKSFEERLKKLIQKPRALRLISFQIDAREGGVLADKVIDEYLETAFTLNAVRVLDRIQRPLNPKAKFQKLISTLEEREHDPRYIRLIQRNGLALVFVQLQRQINATQESSLTYDEKEEKIEQLKQNFIELCRPEIENTRELDQDEIIDIVEIRKQIAGLFQEAEAIRSSNSNQQEKKQQLAVLDKRMVSLLVPVANKVDRLFPHQYATNLTQVLENEEAVCAGKVNVLLAISKYLGLNARANSVEEHLDNGTEGHVCYEGDLPSGARLVIDANFSNVRKQDGKTDTELMERIKRNNPEADSEKLERSLRYAKLARANSKFIPEDSRVLIYTTESLSQTITDDEQFDSLKKDPHLLVRVNPYTGAKEVWKSTVPHPHLLTFPDKDGYLYINSSFTNNSSHFLRKDYVDVGIYLFKKHIEMSPFDARAYTGLAGLLPEKEGFDFLERIKADKPLLYWEGMSIDHAMMYAYGGNLDAALPIFEETKHKNPSAYYKEIHSLVRLLDSEARKNKGEGGKKLKDQAVALMEQARKDNPQAFYAHSLNVYEMTDLYSHDADKEIEVYEEFEKANELKFWDENSSWPPFQRLMDKYKQQAKDDKDSFNLAVEFLDKIKARVPNHYARNLGYYISGLYVHGDRENPSQAIALLEGAKNESATAFFENEHNASILGRAYQGQEQTDLAIALYEEARAHNPNAFWNGMDSLYKTLAEVYKDKGQLDAAIALYEEAKSKSTQFWDSSSREGYSDLADLYAETGRVSEGIALFVEAQAKDPSFFNPSFGERGYLSLAAFYKENGQQAEAIKTLLQGQEQDEEFWKDRYPHAVKLAEYYEDNGQIAEAIAVLEQLKQENEEYWQTRYYRIAELYEKNGNPEKALEIRSELIPLYEALKSSDPEEYYRFAAALARLYAQEGQTKKAIETLEEGRANYEYFPIGEIVRLARLYVQTGDLDKARAAYSDAVKNYKRHGAENRILEVVEDAKTNGIELNI